MYIAPIIFRIFYSPYSVEESRSDLLGDFQNLDEVTVRYSICKSGHDDNGDGDGGLEPVKLFSSCIFDLMKQLFDRLILVPRIKILAAYSRGHPYIT